MSSMTWWRAALLVVAAIATPISQLRAQDARELARRVDSARVRRQRATDALISYRRTIASARVYPDTIAIAGGALVIITTHELLPVVRAGAASADSIVRQRAGGGGSALRGAIPARPTAAAHPAGGQATVVAHLKAGARPA